MTYKIEDGVPVPPQWNNFGIADTIRALDVGQSIFVSHRDVNSVRPTSIRIAKKLGRKFTCRQVEGGYRIWRIE